MSEAAARLGCMSNGRSWCRIVCSVAGVCRLEAVAALVVALTVRVVHLAYGGTLLIVFSDSLANDGTPRSEVQL